MATAPIPVQPTKLRNSWELRYKLCSAGWTRAICAAGAHLAGTGASKIASVHELLALARQAEVNAVGGTGSGVRKADARSHVYLVDDSPADLELLQAVTKFVLPKARSTCLANGFAALMAIGREPPDLLITDIAMPGFNGIEMIRSIRENATTAHVPIIGLSNHHAEEIEHLFGAIPEGVVMLRKPVAPDTLRVAIAHVSHGEAA